MSHYIWETLSSSSTKHKPPFTHYCRCNLYKGSRKLYFFVPVNIFCRMMVVRCNCDGLTAMWAPTPSPGYSTDHSGRSTYLKKSPDFQWQCHKISRVFVLLKVEQSTCLIKKIGLSLFQFKWIFPFISQRSVKSYCKIPFIVVIVLGANSRQMFNPCACCHVDSIL